MSSIGSLAPVAQANADEPSIESLFRAHGSRLVRIARLFVDDTSAAEDLVQEAFIRFHRAHRRLENPDAAAAYLRSTVLNLARDHNRRGLMSLRHIEAHPMGTVGPEPDLAVIMDDDARALLERVGALSKRQRDCLVLRYYLELSYEEIGRTLGVSTNSVKTHLKRALATLRSDLEDRR